MSRSRSHRTSLVPNSRTTRLLLGVVALLVSAGIGNQALARNDQSSASSSGAVVERVVDGDTIVLVGGEKIRLIGPNTPEVVAPNKPVQCYGPEASKRTKELLPPGTQVRLVDDKEREDRYGRHLAYVYRVSDGLFVNADLIQNGYVKAIYYSPNGAHKKDFEQMQSVAQAKKLGMWGAC